MGSFIFYSVSLLSSTILMFSFFEKSNWSLTFGCFVVILYCLRGYKNLFSEFLNVSRIVYGESNTNKELKTEDKNDNSRFMPSFNKVESNFNLLPKHKLNNNVVSFEDRPSKSNESKFSIKKKTSNINKVMKSFATPQEVKPSSELILLKNDDTIDDATKSIYDTIIDVIKRYASDENEMNEMIKSIILIDKFGNRVTLFYDNKKEYFNKINKDELSEKIKNNVTNIVFVKFEAFKHKTLFDYHNENIKK